VYDSYYSYWKQFSRPQYLNFVVIGLFETVEAAENARKVLEDIVQRIGDTYRQKYPDEETFKKAFENVPVTQPPKLTPTEEAIKQQYQATDWELGLVWTLFDLPHEVVRQYDKLVLIGNFDESWTGHPPFDTIMRQLGGDVSIQIDELNWLSLMIKCQAPTESAAKKIVSDSSRLRVGGLSHDFRIKHDDKNIIINNIEILVSPTDLIWDTIANIRFIGDFLTSNDCKSISFQLEVKV
jgi:hypothetical protein